MSGSSPVGWFDLLLAAGVLGVAVVAVAAPRRTASVVGFLVFGVALTLAWARLDAPDVALAEAALGGGVAGALLVDTLRRRRPPRPRTTRPGTPRAGLARLLAASAGGAAGVAVVVALAAVVLALPSQGSSLGGLVVEEMPATGVDHGVTAVLLNYRSYDTLLEVAVLLVAVLAVSSTLGPGAEVVTPAGPREPVLDPALRALTLALLPVLLLLAGWLLVAGTSRPGGAFQSGAVLGAALVVAHLAGVAGAGGEGRLLDVGLVVGLLSFVALAGATALVGGGWLVLDPGWAGAAVLALETVLALSIGASLLRLFVAAAEGREPAR